VDSITHLVLGAAVGELLLGRRLGNRALAWGALLGTLPDLDVLFMPLLDTAGQLWWHRGPSHALVVLVAVSAVLARWLATRWRRDKISRWQAGWFAGAILGSHVLIDCCTVYGTSVLWPFSARRLACNHLFIIDPLVTLPLLIAVARVALLRTKQQLPQRRRINAWGLGLAACYMLLSVGMKFVAAAGFTADLTRRGVTYQRRMESPTFCNILLWRAVVDRGDELWVGYRTVFEFHTTPVRWTVYPRGRAALAGLTDMREVTTLTWFTDGWWIARRHAQGVWVGDLRFDEVRSWGNKKTMVDSRLAFAWNITPAVRGDRLQALHSARPQMGATLSRMASRTIGNRSAWEANPRLAGVTGSLPEFLAVRE